MTHIVMGPEIKYIHITLFTLLSTASSFAEQTMLQNITLDVKQNGILIDMELDKSIDQKNIVVWQSNSDWFYITLYQVTGDSNRLSLTLLPQGIRTFQPVVSAESIQLGLHLRHPIEHYDITLDESTNRILASLHYPYDLFTSLPILNEYDTTEKKLGMNQRLRSWMYITGFSLSVNGLLTQGDGKTNWETIAGLSTLLATYIADKLWPNS
tara:strand:- start:202 stop:834 length:633 start_codon:yes stop_codon:yes gene_type:complete